MKALSLQRERTRVNPACCHPEQGQQCPPVSQRAHNHCSMQVKGLDLALLPPLLDNFQISKLCCPRLTLDKGISVFT